MKRINFNLKNGSSLLRGRLPGQLVIQYSNKCNADCPQCGMRRSNSIARHTLSKDRVKQLIDNAAEAGVQSLSFTGGEPLLFLDDIVELIHYASSAGIPYIRTGTNGFFLSGPDNSKFETKVNGIAEKLASTNLYTFWMSLDSAIPEDHEQLRGLPGIVKGMEMALPIFHSHGIFPSVNLGINRATGGVNNQPFLSELGRQQFERSFQRAFEKFYTFVESIGFTIVNACYPMSDESENSCGTVDEALDSSLYGAASSDSMISFSDEEKELIFKALFNTIPKFRGKLRIFSPRCSLYSLQKKFQGHDKPLYSCRGGTDFFFVESNKGDIYPCGYFNEPINNIPDLTKRIANPKECDRCEWECFRDPSDLLGPFAEFFTKPATLIKKMVKDPGFYKILQEDLRYYRACNFFDGRQPPDFGKMQRFSKAAKGNRVKAGELNRLEPSKPTKA